MYSQKVVKMILHVNVRPSAHEDAIEKISETEYRISLKEHPEKGKANLALVKLLAKHFSVSQKNITIKNPTSRKKIVEIRD